MFEEGVFVCLCLSLIICDIGNGLAAHDYVGSASVRKLSDVSIRICWLCAPSDGVVERDL